MEKVYEDVMNKRFILERVVWGMLVASIFIFYSFVIFDFIPGSEDKLNHIWELVSVGTFIIFVLNGLKYIHVNKFENIYKSISKTNTPLNKHDLLTLNLNHSSNEQPVLFKLSSRLNESYLMHISICPLLSTTGICNVIFGMPIEYYNYFFSASLFIAVLMYPINKTHIELVRKRLEGHEVIGDVA